MIQLFPYPTSLDLTHLIREGTSTPEEVVCGEHCDRRERTCDEASRLALSIEPHHLTHHAAEYGCGYADCHGHEPPAALRARR
jgi:hypothetical protein